TYNVDLFINVDEGWDFLHWYRQKLNFARNLFAGTEFCPVIRNNYPEVEQLTKLRHRATNMTCTQDKQNRANWLGFNIDIYVAAANTNSILLFWVKGIATDFWLTGF